MALMNQIQDMQAQGMSEQDIIQQLKEQGYSPLEISQSLDQTKIKSAVQETTTEVSGMQPGVMEQVPQEQVAEQSEQPEQEYQYPTPDQQYYPQQQQAYPQQQQQYGYQQDYQPYQGASSETFTEIAEQVADEKVARLKKSLGNIEEIRTLLVRKVENMNERLEKIESTIANLQASILGKVSLNIQNIEEIKDEMKMMQNSFSKALNPLIDKRRASESKETVEEEAEQVPEEESRKKPRKREETGDGFENYLR